MLIKPEFLSKIRNNEIVWAFHPEMDRLLLSSQKKYMLYEKLLGKDECVWSEPRIATKENGYPLMNYRHDDGVNKQHYMHRLVAETFLLNPEEKPQVHHRNNNKSDYSALNLEYVTPAQNVQKAVEDGLRSDCKKVGMFSVIEGLIEVFPSLSSAAKSIGVLYNRMKFLVSTKQVSFEGLYFKIIG